MTYTRPNALSIAVTIAISSSIITTQALAARRLQTHSVDFSGSGQAIITQNEVLLKSTFGDARQPIPKSTTTYPVQTQARVGNDVPSAGFTDVLSGIEGGVSTVNLFETDEHDIAEKYTKVLKVGAEEVFRFTHCLKDKKLLIEVRSGMTDPDSVAAVRAQLGDDLQLEPLTGVASPIQLVGVLKGANQRGGSLRSTDHYDVLATIRVKEVEVNGRTFMRLIAASDQPPELQRLGQSLFVNDEVLFAAATSAYTQVHILGENLQQEALDDLLSYQKPVGYVVHVEDNTQVYPVPEGYPKLEVTEAPGEIIVFHGQKHNPTDVAFVESLQRHWEEFDANDNDYTTKIKRNKVKSYQYIIRSRQMALLEEFSAKLAVQHDAELNVFKLSTLTYYESLRQALAVAAQDETDEFEFSTTKHIRVTSSVITPIWMQVQLEKHFSFKPVLRELLTNPYFVQNVRKDVESVAELMQSFAFDEGAKFAHKVIGDMTTQLHEMEIELDELQEREGRFTGLSKRLQRAIGSYEEKLRVQPLKLEIDDELIKLRNLELATQLGMDDWDDTLPLVKQAELISIKIHEINLAIAATGQFDHKAVKAKLAGIEGQLGISPVDENDLDARFQSIQQQIQHIQHKTKQADEETLRRLTTIEGQLALRPNNEADLEARHQAILQHLKQRDALFFQLYLQQQSTRKDAGKEAEIKARYATIATHLKIPNFDSNADIEVQQESILASLAGMNLREEVMRQKLYEMNNQRNREDSYTRIRKVALAAVLGIELSDVETRLKNRDTLESTVYFKLFKLKELEEELKDIGTPGHPKAKPEVVGKLTAVENSLKMHYANSENDVYYRRHTISKKIQAYITASRQRVEGDAQVVLKTVEEILGINVNEGDDKATRLDRIRTKLENNDLSDSMLDAIVQTFWKEDITHASQQRATKYENLKRHLTFYVEDANERAIRQQIKLFKEIEAKLHICFTVSNAAKERGRTFLAKLANDLGIILEDDIHLSDNKYAISNEISALMEEVGEVYGDKDVKRVRNNEIAHQINIENYKDDATIEDQNILINKKLQQLSEEVFKAGVADVNEHIAAIENELDRQIARLGPKPRYVLDREVATAWRAIEDAESELETANQKLDAILVKQYLYAGTRAVQKSISDEGDRALNQAMKELQIKFDLAAGDEQPLQERVKDITHFLPEQVEDIRHSPQGDSRESRDKIVQKLRAKTDAVVQEAYNENNEVLSELTLTREKHSQVTEFLREQDRKSMEVTHTRHEEKNARENPDRKKQEIEDPGNIDEQAKTAHNKEIKQLQPGSSNVISNKIRQLIHKRARLESEIEVRKADIERMKDVLKAAREAVKNDDGPFQYTPRQAEVRAAMAAFIQQHPLKQQALGVALGLTDAARESGKATPLLATFDFDDEFAPIRLQAMVGNKLTFKQASRIVEVFKSLKTTLPESRLEPLADQPRNALIELETLTLWAMYEMETGAQEYDDEIRGLGKAAISFVEHEPENLKSFSEYFATHSASGNRIIALLREGLISKIELEHYIKAIRGVDGYQTVAEFEHFLGYKHGVRVSEFRKVVHMLSDRDAEEFMQSAFTPVTVTTTGPAGMKESVAGMREYAAAVIANYILDDIAFDSGRRTAAFLANIQDTLAPYAYAADLSESDLIKAINDTLMQAHASAVERQLSDYWVKPSVFLLQAVTWYYSSYKPLMVTQTALGAARLSLSNMAFLYLLDLTNRGDYTHRILTPFQHWLERYGVDLDRVGQYAYHSGIEKISEAGGLAMPLGKAASSVILLKTGSL
uniref:hypothetical protein n=1 Tax=Endozoicomonas sp. SESOKO4 TaxID=2828745 RepID=UPI0021492E55